MRRAKSEPVFFPRLFLGLVAAAGLIPPVWAYVNGGDFHSTLKTLEKKLRAEGWEVASGIPLPEDCDRTGEVAKGLPATPADNPRYCGYVNQLVGRVLLSLPKKEAAQISAEARREVMRLTREALRDGALHKRQTIKKGQVGALQYQVGACAFESYWETNYGGKREIHAHRSGLAPFVALKVVGVKERAK